MAEANTADVEAKADAAFGAGFSGTPPVEPEKVVAEVTPDLAVPAVVVPPPVIAPEKPQYVRLTKQEWDNTKAAAGKVSTLESQVAKLVGSMPKADQLVQQVIESVRSQTPAGTEIDPQVLIDAFADQEKDFPELAGQNRKAIEYILKNLRGTVGTAQSPAPPVDIEAVADRVRVRMEEYALNRSYPDWSDVVGRPPTADAPIPETPFRVWLGKQSAEYQKAVNETDSHADIQEAIASFRASQGQPAPSPKPDRAAARRATLEDAITPRADGNPPPLNSPQTAEDAFGKAFNSVKSH